MEVLNVECNVLTKTQRWNDTFFWELCALLLGDDEDHERLTDWGVARVVKLVTLAPQAPVGKHLE